MEINPGGVITILLTIFGVASFACMGILVLLNLLKVTRLGTFSIVFWGIIAGIFVTLILLTSLFS